MEVVNKKIVFFFLADDKMGGIENLFIRLARLLIKDKFRVYILCKKESIFHQFFSKEEVTYITFDLKKTILPDNATVISPLFYPHLIKFLSGKGLKFLFWSLYDKSALMIEVYRFISFFNFYFKKNFSVEMEKKLMQFLNFFLWRRLRQFFELANKKDALVYMDKDHVFFSENHFDLVLKPNILPLGIDVPAYKLKKLKNSKPISVCWLGRLVDFKVLVLQDLIFQLSRFCKKNPDQRMHLYIIGEGNYYNKVRSFILDHKSENFDIEMIGQIYGDPLDQFLTERVDLLCAHGTAILEGAKLGIPSLLIEHHLENYSQGTKGIWLFECNEEGYVGAFRPHDVPYCFIEDALYDLLNDPNIGFKCYQHVQDGFNIETIKDKFIQAIDKTNLSKEDIVSTGITRNTFWFKIIFYTRKILRTFSKETNNRWCQQIPIDKRKK